MKQSSTNQRLPFLDIQNKKKNENSNANKIINKSVDQNVPMELDDMRGKNNLKAIKDNKDQIKSLMLNSPAVADQRLGDEEYLECLKKALREAFDENDELRSKIQMIIEENKELKVDLEEKTNALLELAKFYEFCQNNHMNNDVDITKEKKSKKKRKSNSL